MSPRSGAQHAIGALEALGARHVFGMPGTQNLSIFEALRTSRLRTIVPTHEMGAAFMAGAYYRVSGRPGIVVTIPGPGFAYALPGIAEARLDSAALVHITCEPAPHPEKRFRLQHIDQETIAGPLVKRIFNVDRAADAAGTVRAAWAEALRGEPGPVLVQIARDALESEAADDGSAGDAAPGGLEPSADEDVWALVRERVSAARRPVLLVGQGCQTAAAALREFAERVGAPVLTTPSGRGVLPEDHPLAMGFDAPRGTLVALNELLQSADLVLALGCKLGHNGSVGFEMELPRSRSLRVDTSAEVLDADYPAALEVEASVAEFFVVCAESGAGQWDAAEVAGWKRRLSAPEDDLPEPHMAGQEASEFFRSLRRVLPRDAIITTDSGLHQVLARRHLAILSPGGLLMPADFQSMGFGIPAGIAAKLAAPDRPAVVLVGDGGFAMSGLELLTAVRERLAVVVMVFNDGWLGQIRLQQVSAYGRAHGVDRAPMDFAAFAEAAGCAYLHAGRDAADALEQALDLGTPVVVEVEVGDSWQTRRHGVAKLARAVARGAAGPRVTRWVKRLLGRER